MMKNFSHLVLVIFIILCCLTGWILYGYANCGLPGHPADAPSESSSSGPASPEVYKKNKTWTEAVPKLPGYAETPSGSPPPEGEAAPPPNGPRIKKGLLDKIRATPRTPAEDESPPPLPSTPQKPSPTFPSGCEECFLVVVEQLSSNEDISQSARGNPPPWSRQFEKEAFSKAIDICEEKFGKDNCSRAYECDLPRQVVTEQVDDIYPEDGDARTAGIKTTVGIYFRCVPKPPESPFTPGTGIGEGPSIQLQPPSQPPEGGSEQGGGSRSGPGVIITEEEEIDLDGTVPPEPPPEPPSVPKPPQPSGPSNVPETQEEGTEAPHEPPPANLGVSHAPAAGPAAVSEKPSGCGECFKVVVETPFSSAPFEDSESQWQEEAFNKAKGICQETCSDKGCAFSIPCGEKPVERKEIYPENLYFDPTAGKVSEGMKTRIGIYYKCIPPIGEETTSQVIVTPPKEKVTIPPQETEDIGIGRGMIDTPLTEKVARVTSLSKETVTSQGDIVIPKEETVIVPEEKVIVKEDVLMPPKEDVIKIPEETVVIPKEDVVIPPKETIIPPKEDDIDIPKEKIKIPKETVTPPPKEEDVYIPQETVTKTTDKVTVPPKDIDSPPPKDVDYPPPKEKEECDCKYLDQEWVIGQTIEGKYVYIPDPKIDYKIPVEGYKRRVELKAAGADEDILILRAEKTKNGERVCIRSKNVFSPDLIKYTWEIIEGPGNFKNGRRVDDGESVIYIPPDDLPFGEHPVVIETVIDNIPGKAPDEENKGKIRMLIKHREEEPDFYFIDFGISDFAPPGGSIPPELPCACEIFPEWKEEVALVHNIVLPAEGTMYCPECTDVWIGHGADVDRLIVKCADPECGEDIQKFPIVDVWIHSWAANLGSYLDGNTGRKVLYKAPADVPPGPIPNEVVMLNTKDSGRQFIDDEPDPDKKRITIVNVDLAIHKPPVIDPAESEIPEEEEFKKGSQTFVNLDNDDRDTLYDTATTDVSIVGEDEMVKLTLRLKPKDIDRGNVRLEALTGAEYIKVWREANKTTEYVLGSPLIVPNDFRVEGDFLLTNLYVEGIKPHTDQRQTQLRMTYDQVPDCFDKVSLTIIGIDKIEWIGKNNSRDDDNALDADPNFPAGLGVNGLRVFPDARLIGGAMEGSFRDKVDVKAKLTVKPIEAVKIYFDSFDVDDPSKDRLPVDDETIPEDNRGLVPTKSGLFDGEVGGIKEQDFDDQEETFEFHFAHQPGDNFRVVGNGDRDFLTDLENDDAAVGASDADKLRIVNHHVTGSLADREVREHPHYASDLLTVWRFLHVEVDSMGVVTGNAISGEIVNMTPRDSARANRLFVNNNLDDLSVDLSDVAPGNGRFENGTITISGRPDPLFIQGNGNDFVQNMTGLNITPVTFSAIDNDSFGNSTMAGTIPEIVHNGVNWVLTLHITSVDPLAVDWSDFVGGTISISGGPDVTISNTSAATASVQVKDLRIPYTLKDDDTVIADVPDPDTSGIETTYAPVYIVPLLDTGHNTPNAPFVLNSNGIDQFNQIDASRDSPLNTDRCWIVSVLGSYQMDQDIFISPAGFHLMERDGDNDPDNEGTSRATAWIDAPAQGVMMGTESIRDWIATPAPLGPGGGDPAGAGRQMRRQEILNHEIGHLFDLEHADGFIGPFDPQGGVMAPSCCPPDNPAQNTRGISTFTELSISKIRARLHPGNP